MGFLRTQSVLSPMPIVATLAILALTTTPFSAADAADAADAGSPARVDIETSRVVWSPSDGEHGGLHMTVLGPEGFELERTFAPGEAPTLSIFDAAGQPLPDGLYSYSLLSNPHPFGSGDVRLERPASEISGREGSASGEGGSREKGRHQSGYFSVRDGAFVLPQAELSAAGDDRPREIAERATVLTISDGTISNSLCVGANCTSSPTFDDTTVLIQEVNTRIKFDDQSSSSFPNNDWEIEANSSLSGGANYLGINDCGNSSQGGCADNLVFAVEAGAPTNALHVRSNGHVGFGLLVPAAELHSRSGDTPTLRLEQDTSGGFAAQAWDIAGNESSFFIRDVTNGEQLPFRIYPAAGSSLVTLRDSRVGVRDATPDDFLDVDIDANGGLSIQSQVNGALPQLTMSELDGTWRLRVNDGGHFVFTDATSGTSPIQVIKGSDTNLLRLSGNDVTVTGDFSVSGVKSFVMPDPVEKGRSLHYVALEGPEAGTYYRGTARTVDGKAVIDLPAVFSRATEEEGLTVQLTAVGGDHHFWVESQSRERLVVREASGKDGAELHFLVQGVRLGYADYQVSRPAVDPRSE